LASEDGKYPEILNNTKDYKTCICCLSNELNLSNNSGSLPSGRLSALSQHSDRGGNKSDSESEEESSDWDSWDEEPEVRN
jgi:hypothetical protein